MAAGCEILGLGGGVCNFLLECPISESSGLLLFWKNPRLQKIDWSRLRLWKCQIHRCEVYIAETGFNNVPFQRQKTLLTRVLNDIYFARVCKREEVSSNDTTQSTEDCKKSPRYCACHTTYTLSWILLKWRYGRPTRYLQCGPQCKWGNRAELRNQHFDNQPYANLERMGSLVIRAPMLCPMLCNPEVCWGFKRCSVECS